MGGKHHCPWEVVVGYALHTTQRTRRFAPRRQAGRYMKAFREYSDVIPFRTRSETPAVAIELR